MNKKYAPQYLNCALSTRLALFQCVCAKSNKTVLISLERKRNERKKENKNRNRNGSNLKKMCSAPGAQLVRNNRDIPTTQQCSRLSIHKHFMPNFLRFSSFCQTHGKRGKRQPAAVTQRIKWKYKNNTQQIGRALHSTHMYTFDAHK